MAKVDTFDKFVAYRHAHGGTVNQKDFTVAASTTIKYGDIVKLSSGEVVQAIAVPGSNNSGTASGGDLGILGIALAPITTGSGGTETGTGRSTIPVAVFDDNLEIALRIYNATASSAEAQDLTLGTSYQFQNWRGANSSTWWYSLITTTTNGEMIYVERSAESAAGDDYGIVWVKAEPSVRQG